MNPNLLFQYCPKIVLFSADKTKVLLAKRQGEQDYDGTFSFIGGKTETTDDSLIAGLHREKNEEIGEAAKISIAPYISCHNVLFRKKDGNSMVLPHHIATFVGGEITLNPDEYAEYQWVPIENLEQFEPKVENIAMVVQKAQQLLAVLKPTDFVEI